MTKYPMTTGYLKIRMSSKSATINLGENEMQFLGFLPEWSGCFAQARYCSHNHPDEKLGLPGFLLASSDLVTKVFLGNTIVSFAIVRTNARPRPHELINQ